MIPSMNIRKRHILSYLNSQKQTNVKPKCSQPKGKRTPTSTSSLNSVEPSTSSSMDHLNSQKQTNVKPKCSQPKRKRTPTSTSSLNSVEPSTSSSTDRLNSQEQTNVEPKCSQPKRKRTRKSTSSLNSVEPSNSSSTDRLNSQKQTNIEPKCSPPKRKSTRKSTSSLNSVEPSTSSSMGRLNSQKQTNVEQKCSPPKRKRTRKSTSLLNSVEPSTSSSTDRLNSQEQTNVEAKCGPPKRKSTRKCTSLLNSVEPLTSSSTDRSNSQEQTNVEAECSPPKRKCTPTSTSSLNSVEPSTSSSTDRSNSQEQTNVEAKCSPPKRKCTPTSTSSLNSVEPSTSSSTDRSNSQGQTNVEEECSPPKSKCTPTSTSSLNSVEPSTSSSTDRSVAAPSMLPNSGRSTQNMSAARQAKIKKLVAESIVAMRNNPQGERRLLPNPHRELNTAERPVTLVQSEPEHGTTLEGPSNESSNPGRIQIDIHDTNFIERHRNTDWQTAESSDPVVQFFIDLRVTMDKEDQEESRRRKLARNKRRTGNSGIERSTYMKMRSYPYSNLNNLSGVIIGPNGTTIPLDEYLKIDWQNSSAATVTRQLITEIFDHETLATHFPPDKDSRTGPKLNRTKKQILNPYQVSDVVYLVNKMLKNVDQDDIYWAIELKCLEEKGLYLKNQHKRLMMEVNNA